MARLLLVLIAVTAALLAAAAAPAGGGGVGPSGRILYVTNGDRLNSIDVTSGERVTRRVSVAGCGPDVYLTGGHVVFAELRKRKTIVYSVPAELDREPRRLGAAHAFVPSQVDGRVWMSGRVCTSEKLLEGAREVGVDGEVTASTRHAPPSAWLIGALDDGLLFGKRRSLLVWDPESGRTVRRLEAFEWVEAIHGDRIAGCAADTRCRALAIADLATGKTVVAEVKKPYGLGGDSEFSPDGSLVATPVVAKRRWSVALVDTGDGSVSHVPGSEGRNTFPELAWSEASGWLYFRSDRGRVMAYRPGEREAVALPLRLPRTAVHFMAG
jgi:hypothetical protein